jgi:hypothetical protein
MKVSSALERVLKYSLVLSLLLGVSAFADNLLITRHFSGVWDQPEQESQGILLQIGEQDGDEKVGVAYWFTYGEDLQTTWYLAVGPVNGNEINMDLYTAFDVAFMEDNVKGDANVEQVGTLDLVFKNCNHGTATYETEDDVIGSGEFPIKRISSIYRTRCSGGISDDTPANRKPLQLEVLLKPALEGGPGEGKAKFWERTDRSDFKVEIEAIPEGDGPYRLEVCEDPKGEFTLTAGEGELVFRSPAAANVPLLDFDPRLCAIEVFDGADLLLTSGDARLSEKEHGNSGKDKPSMGKVKLEADLTPMEGFEGAKGEAQFEIRMHDTEFSIKIKDVPTGLYTAVVAGNVVGEIEVIEEDGDFVGQIKFTDPQKNNTQELDFDPRGEIIEILQADDTVILVTDFPNE